MVCEPCAPIDSILRYRVTQTGAEIFLKGIGSLSSKIPDALRTAARSRRGMPAQRGKR